MTKILTTTVVYLALAYHGLIRAGTTQTASESGTSSGITVTKPIRILYGHTDIITCATFSMDGERVLTGSRDATARLWNLRDETDSKVLRGHSEAVTGVVSQPVTGTIGTVSEDKSLRFWNYFGDFIVQSETFPSGLYSLAFSPDGKKIILGTGTFPSPVFVCNPSISLYDATTGGAPIMALGETNVGFYTSLAFSPAGDRIISAYTKVGKDACTVWDSQTGESLFVASGASAIAYAPSGLIVGLVANTLTGNAVFIFETKSWKKLYMLPERSALINSIAFSLDSSYIAVALDDGTVELQEIATGNIVRAFIGHTKSVNVVVFSPDGLRILTGSSDQTARIWSARFLRNADPDAIKVIEKSPVRPVYGELPKKQDGKDSLIVVTHGWQLKLRPVDISWVDDMTNSITAYLTLSRMSTWQVHAHKWIDGAWTHFPGDALRHGEMEGGSLGNHLAKDGWKHIHFIGHSAGAALIQTASERVKRSNKKAKVHTTFLDAYTGLTDRGRSEYGDSSDWSDSYFSRDFLTGASTEGPLDHAYNVDVTYLDPQKVEVDGYLSTSSGISEPCRVTRATHRWPVDFYLSTVKEATTLNYQKSFGFRLSKEGGRWDYALSDYVAGNTPLLTLGTPDAPCYEHLEVSTPPVIGPVMSFRSLPAQESRTGLVEEIWGGIKLTTGSPAWLMVLITLTNPVNFVAFDMGFASVAGAQGLLSLYWDTNAIGSVDEQIFTSNIEHQEFSFPKAEVGGSHLLGFRLDAFTNVVSSVTVRNIKLGLTGPSQPFSLAVNESNGLRVYEISGQKGFTYFVEASTDLRSWETTAILANTNGIVRFVDQPSTNTVARFYRAIVK